MLEAIVRIRTTLAFQGKCCTKFEATKQMLKLFSNQMYLSTEEKAGNNNGSSEEDENDDEVVELLQ